MMREGGTWVKATNVIAKLIAIRHGLRETDSTQPHELDMMPVSIENSDEYKLSESVSGMDCQLSSCVDSHSAAS